MDRTRCAWVPEDEPLVIRYHDEEWGVPLYDDRSLFELLVLEGFQAGLSWSLILHRRDGFRAAFEGFDPERLARLPDEALARLTGDERIVRNRRKVEAARTNARAFLRLREDASGFAGFLWSFVGGEPRRNRWRAPGEVPSRSPESEALARELKRRGFAFVGPTICYAFMQAAGLVNDHLVGCFRHAEL